MCYASDRSVERVVSFKVDAGADVSTLDIELYRSMLNLPDLRQTSDTLPGAGGEIECYGKFPERQENSKIKNMRSISMSLMSAIYWAELMLQHWAFSNSTEIREPYKS